MAEVPKANPCHECPFRKKSLRGYTGPHEHFVEIERIVNMDGKFPCHMRVTSIIEQQLHGDGDNAENLNDAIAQAPFCTGAIAFMNNSCKLVRHPDAAQYADKIGQRDDVFANPIEAQAYHHGVDDVRMRHPAPDGQPLRLTRKQVKEWLKRTKSTCEPSTLTATRSRSAPAPSTGTTTSAASSGRRGPSGGGTTRSRSTGSSSKARSRSGKSGTGKARKRGS